MSDDVKVTETSRSIEDTSSDQLKVDIVGEYMRLLIMLDKLPPGRQKSLAITTLEESYSHAIFAAHGINSPIRFLDP